MSGRRRLKDVPEPTAPSVGNGDDERWFVWSVEFRGEARHGDFDRVDLARVERRIVCALRPRGAPELIDTQHAAGVSYSERGDRAFDQ
jgi:hypothetical protein